MEETPRLKIRRLRTKVVSDTHKCQCVYVMPLSADYRMKKAWNGFQIRFILLHGSFMIRVRMANEARARIYLKTKNFNGNKFSKFSE